MVTSQGPCGEHVHQFEMFAILQYVAELAVTLLLGNRRCHGNHFVLHSLGSSLTPFTPQKRKNWDFKLVVNGKL